MDAVLSWLRSPGDRATSSCRARQDDRGGVDGAGGEGAFAELLRLRAKERTWDPKSAPRYRGADEGGEPCDDEPMVILIVNDDDIDDAYIDDVIPDGGHVKVPMYLTDALERFALADARFGIADHVFDGYRRGYVQMTAADAADVRDARQEMIDRATSAWRGPQRDARKPAPDDDGDDDDDEPGEPLSSEGQYNRQYKSRRVLGRSALSHEVDARLGDQGSSARDAYVRRLTDAWRSPAGDAAEPDTSTSPEELMMRRHVYGAPGLGDPAESHAEEFRGEQAQRARDAAWRRYRDNLSNQWRGGKTDPGRAAQVEGLQERWRHGRDVGSE